VKKQVSYGTFGGVVVESAKPKKRETSSKKREEISGAGFSQGGTVETRVEREVAVKRDEGQIGDGRIKGEIQG